MDTLWTSEASAGHFDRHSNLIPLLESFVTPVFDSVTLDEYEALSPQQRAEYDMRRLRHVVTDVVVKTPALTELLREVGRASARAHRPIGRVGVVLSGPPTAGKTTGAYHAMVEALRRHERRYPDWKSMGHLPLVYLEVPPGATAKSIMGRFMRFMDLPCHPRMTLEERTQVVTEALVRGRTSLVCIDEFQNLGSNRGHSEASQAIKNLLNAVPCVPLYVGIDLEKSLLGGNGLGTQFASRSKLVRLGKLGVSTADERRLWGGVVYSFERQLCLLSHEPKSLLPLADYLWKRTRGSIGALASLLTTAATDLIDAGKPADEQITKQLLDTISLDLTTESNLNRALSIETRSEQEAEDAA